VSETPASQGFWGRLRRYGVNGSACVPGLSGNVDVTGLASKRPADQSGVHTSGGGHLRPGKHNIGGGEKAYWATIQYAFTALPGSPLVPRRVQGLVPIRHKRFLASSTDPFRHPSLDCAASFRSKTSDEKALADRRTYQPPRTRRASVHIHPGRASGASWI